MNKLNLRETLCIRLAVLSNLFGIFSNVPVVSAYWTYPNDGWATMTHYDMPNGFVASCGCTGESTKYPTVALSQLAFGSTTAFGPSCGRCMNLTLVNSIYSDPPYYPNPTKSIVVKVTDLCPAGPTLCGATEGHPNSVGSYLNFDLAYPSVGIPDGWYPSNVTEYGYVDFGVWNVTYASIDCSYWAGWHDQAALGSVPNHDPGVCCPAQVNETFVCPSYSEENGLPPDTTTNTASMDAPGRKVSLLSITGALLLLYHV